MIKKQKNDSPEFTVSEVLTKFVSQIELIDFRAEAEMAGESKVSHTRYLVTSIKELLDTAISNNWGLCTHNEIIYIYNGSHWQQVDKNTFKVFLSDAAVAMGVPELNAKYYKFQNDLYDQFLSMAVLPEARPRNGVLINLHNGTYEIEGDERQFREHRREDFLTYKLSFDYDPHAKCPMFRQYLRDVLPDLDCRKILAEFMGYIFTTTLKLEKVLFLYGTGSNGKSVFFDVMNAVIGSENISSFSLQSLTRDSGERAEISTKLLNYSTEINNKMDDDMFKKLASGEPVQARYLYRRPFTMRDYNCKLMFNCNTLPNEMERTHAYFRRLLIIPFNRIFHESEQNINLAKEIIAAELSGVFNWVLGGLNRLLTQKKFTDSAVVKQQVEDYRKESDSVALFLDDRGIGFGIDKSIPLSVIYLDYVEFCKEYGFKPFSVINMSKRLKIAGLVMVKANYGMTVWFGKSKERIQAEQERKERREKYQARLRDEYEGAKKSDESDD